MIPELGPAWRGGVGEGEARHPAKRHQSALRERGMHVFSRVYTPGPNKPNTLWIYAVVETGCASLCTQWRWIHNDLRVIVTEGLPYRPSIVTRLRATVSGVEKSTPNFVREPFIRGRLQALQRQMLLLGQLVSAVTAKVGQRWNHNIRTCSTLRLRPRLLPDAC